MYSALLFRSLVAMIRICAEDWDEMSLLGKNWHCRVERWMNEVPAMSSRRRRERVLEVWRMNCQQCMLTVTVVVQVLHEEEERERLHRGSVVGREIVKRDKYDGYHHLMKDYFLNPSIFSETFFRRRFGSLLMACSVRSF
jgi:hypothetical protein